MPDNAADFFFDQAAKDAINLARVEAGSVLKVKSFLADLEAEIVKTLAQNKDLSPGKVAKLQAILKAGQDAIGTTYESIATDNAADLKGVATYQSKAVQKTMNAVVGVDVFGATVTESQLTAIVKDSFIQGHPAADWWAAQSEGTKAKFTAAVNTGYALGEDIDAITRRIRGTKANGFTDGVMQASRREGEALARTAVQTISNNAKLESFKNLGDTIKGIEWLATLDTRTTIICRALDGKQWTFPDLKPVGHVKIFPGAIAHWNCRSTTIAVLYSWAEMSGKKIAALDGATLQAKMAEKLKAKGWSDDKIAKAQSNARATMDGQASGSPDMEAWLKKQPDAKVKAMLGPSRANLLATGKITVSDLTDQNNRPLTVAQLNAAIDAGDFPVETEGIDFQPFDLEKAKPPSKAAAEALQKAAADKIAAVMADPKAKGNSILATNLAKVQTAEPGLSPAELLAKAEELTAAKIEANTKSSVLSKAKKKILAGEAPTAAQQALIDGLGDDEKAAWLESIGDAKKASAADIAAKKLAAADKTIDDVLASGTAKFKTPEEIEAFIDGLDTVGIGLFEKSALQTKLTTGFVGGKVEAIKAKVTKALAADPMADYGGASVNDVFELFDLDPKAASDLENFIFSEQAKAQAGVTVKDWKADKTKVFAIEAAEKTLGPDADPAAILTQAKVELADIVAINVMTNGTAASQKAIKALTGMNSPTDKSIKAWLTKEGKDPETFLAEWEALTAEKAQQAVNSSVLSKAKKKLAAGELPTPAQKALIDSLSPEEKADFIDQVVAIKDKLDAEKALKAAKLDGAKNAVVAGLPMDPDQIALLNSMTPAEKKAFWAETDALSKQAKADAAKLAKEAADAQAKADADAKAAAAAQQAADAQAKAQKAAADAAAKAAKKAADAKTAAESQAIAQQAAQQAKTAQATVPHPDDLKIVGKLGGSTGAQLAEDKAGNRYVVKKGASPDHVRTEQTADDLYRAFGLDVPDGALFETPEGPVKVSRFLEGSKPLASLTGKAREDAFARLRKGFQVDALMGNWDVAGTGMDNVLVTPDGKVWRIDNGGSLKFRAQGGLKDSQAWNRYPDELWTMRDPSNISGPIYGSMDIFEISRGIENQSWAGLADVALDTETRDILEGRIFEMKHLARRSLDFESDGYNVTHSDGVAKATLELRQIGVSDSMPKKLNSSGSAAYNLTDENGRSFGNLRSGSTPGGAPVLPKVAGDVYGEDILTATKALASCALNTKDVSSGSAPGKMATIKAHVPDLKNLATYGTPEQVKMAKDYLAQIDALVAIEKAGGIPTITPPQFSAAVPANVAKPTVQNAKSVVKQWEAQMAAEGINTAPISDWMSSQSGNSWSPKTQGMKVAFAKGMTDPESGFYWGGNGSYTTSWKDAQVQYQVAVKAAGGEAKLQRLVTSWHALNQEILSEIDAPWVDRERRAVLLLRTVTQDELAGSTVTPTVNPTWQAKKDALEARKKARPGSVTASEERQLDQDSDRFLPSEFTPLRGVTESHSIFKQTNVIGNKLTIQAVPFSRVLATYWTEKPGTTGGSGFLGDSEAEFAANTSGIKAFFKPGYTIPKTDEKSKDAANWGVPLDHLRDL